MSKNATTGRCTARPKLEGKNNSQLSRSSKSNLECKFLNSSGQPGRGRSA